MSSISAGVTSGTALVSSGDTTGQLVFQTNGTTTAMTIGTNQVVSLAQPLPVSSGGTGTTSSTFVNLASNVTGTLPVGNGGTGATTLTANNVILGNGGSAVQFVAPGSNGNVLTSNGTTWTSAAAPSAAGSVTATASGSINSNSPVLMNSNGTVSAPTISTTPSSIPADVLVSTLTANTTNASIVYIPTIDRYMAFYAANSTGNLTAKQGTPDNEGNISWGTATTISAGNFGAHISAVWCENLSNNTVAVFAGQGGGASGLIFAGTCTSSSFSFGGSGASSGRSDNYGGIAWDKNNQIGMVNGVDGATARQFACAFTISGTTVTTGSPASNSIGYECGIEYDPSSGYFLMVARGLSNVCTIQPATTTASRVVTLFTMTQVSSGTALPYGIAYVPSAGRCIVATSNGGNQMTAFYVTMTGSTPSATGSATYSTTVQTSQFGIGVDTTNGVVSFLYRNSSTGAIMAVNSLISGTTISFGTPAQISSRNEVITSNTGKMPFDSTRARICAFYGGLYATTYKAATSTLTAANYIGISTASYTNGQTATIRSLGGLATGLSSITPGSIMYVSGSSLTTTNTGVVAGRGISSTSMLVTYN